MSRGTGDGKKEIPAVAGRESMARHEEARATMPVETGLQKEEGNSWGQRRIGRRAAGAVTQTLRAGAALYERARDLPRLARVDPASLGADTIESTKDILMRLERALRAERNRARSGHWTYDLNRHIALRQAYLAESDRLRTLEAARD